MKIIVIDGTTDVISDIKLCILDSSTAANDNLLVLILGVPLELSIEVGQVTLTHLYCSQFCTGVRTVCGTLSIYNLVVYSTS